MTSDRLGVARLTLASLMSVVCWTLGALFFTVMGALLLPFRLHGVHRLGQRWLKQIFTFYVQVLGAFNIAECDYVGFEKLPRHAGGYIVAPNHPAMWDVVFLLSRLVEGVSPCLLTFSSCFQECGHAGTIDTGG